MLRGRLLALAVSLLLGAAAATSATVRFVLVGDSTVTDDIGWGLGFTARLTSHAVVVNLARNGRSSRSFIDEGHWRAAVAQGADVILI